MLCTHLDFPMRSSINIIARNNCKLNVNVSGNYTLALTGVTGPYNIVLLKKGRDFLRIKTHPDTRYLDDIPRANYLKMYRDEIEAREDLDAETKEGLIKEKTYTRKK